MKKTILILCLFATGINRTFAQEISKDKTIAIENIKAAGYEIKDLPAENKFSYARFDKYGKSVVSYEYAGNIIRSVTFLCDDVTMAGKMFSDVERTTTSADIDRARKEFGEPRPQQMYSYSSPYYKGKARYLYLNNTFQKIYTFKVVLLE